MLLAVTKAHSQIDWKNYSTSFYPTLGVAVPYNGTYSNCTTKIVGIAHWNPQYKIAIDSSLTDLTPLSFVYDTAGIYFLIPQVNKNNTDDFEYSVLLNNKTVITPWTHINQFTQTAIGGIPLGSGITGSYSANWGNYVVMHLRSHKGKIISSWVVYWQLQTPEISLLYTSNNPLEFSKIVNNKDLFANGPREIGWHRQYANIPDGQKKVLKLPYNENSILLKIDASIYKKEALEYRLESNGKIIRDWGPNEYDNNHILLKNLDPGDYLIRIRFKRQPQSIKEFHFSITPAWYQTAIFKIACFAFIIFLFALLLFIFRYRKQQQRIKKVKEEFEKTQERLQQIYARLNPHFTFNALSSIQGLVNKNDIPNANKYLSSFSTLLRETLQESKLDLIPLDKELKNLQGYIELEQLRCAFVYNLTIDPLLQPSIAQIPPFLLQPFVENAIHHVFSKSGSNGILTISVLREKENMQIRIQDNGTGFNVSSYREGYGLGLSKERIAILNKGYGNPLIQLSIKSDATGTTLSLLFLNWL